MRQEELARSPQLMSFGELLLGQALVGLRRVAEARGILDSALARQSAAYGPTHPITVSTAAQLLFLAVVAGDSAAAARFAPLFPPDTVAAIQRRARATGSPT